MKIPPPLIVAFVIMGIGFLWIFIAMVTVEWLSFDSLNFDRGLFKFCYLDECEDLAHLDHADRLCQAMIILGFLSNIALLAALVVLGILIYQDMDAQKKKQVTTVIKVASALTSIFYIILLPASIFLIATYERKDALREIGGEISTSTFSIFLFSDQEEEDDKAIGFSFGFFIIGLLTIAVADIVMHVQLKKMESAVFPEATVVQEVQVTTITTGTAMSGTAPAGTARAGAPGKR